MSKPITKISAHLDHYRFGKHRFEHWYVDNQVYFITARCRNRYPAFDNESAKAIFWDRFDHYTREAHFKPWVVSLMDNHYHLLGYNSSADALRVMMQRLHGSIAKLTNDVLAEQASTGGGHFSGRLNPHGRLKPFWRDTRGREFFDGCLRDTKQCRLAYRYVLTQCRRHGVCDRHEDYPHTRVVVDLERGIKRAIELAAFMPEIPYPRYFRERDGR